jgi:hypothetical protein
LMTVGMSQASVVPPAPLQRPFIAAAKPIVAAQIRLKSELLSLGREEKLRIAGDRVQLSASDRSKTQLAYVKPSYSNCCPHTVRPGGMRAQTFQPAMGARGTVGCPHGMVATGGTCHAASGSATPVAHAQGHATAMCTVGTTNRATATCRQP